jgi:hypothetical protein
MPESELLPAYSYFKKRAWDGEELAEARGVPL